MKSNLILLLLYLVILLPACENHESQKEKNDILTEWIPFFSTNENLSGITETEKLVFCYQESKSRAEGKTKKTYPPYFGGMYFRDSNNKDYVILLTDTNRVIKDAFIKMCSLTPENITFKLCEYTLNELFDLQEQIIDSPNFFEKWDVLAVCADQKENKVVIRFNGKSDVNKINLFKTEISDSPMIDFEFANDEIINIQNTNNKSEVHSNTYSQKESDKYNAMPGDALYTIRGSDEFLGSIGFFIDITIGWPQGTTFPMTCFVSAAHIFEEENEELYYNHDKHHYGDFRRFGIVYKLNRGLDIAECTAYDENSVLMADYDPVPRYPSVNQKISATGACFESRNYYSGTVTKLGVIKNIKYNNVMCAEIMMDNNKRVFGGCSGGIVLTTDNQVAGILVAVDQVCPWRAYFVPALLITTELGLRIGK